MRAATRGQVLVLAALLAVFLCLAVLATVTLGQTIYERVQLQHTADAAAYSMATLEAQTFNVYAQVNRAHASHYVSAMMWQSLLSHLFFTEAFLTDLLGLANSFPCLAPQGPWKAICAAVKKIPAVGATLGVLESATSILADVTQAYQEGLRLGDDGLDRAVGQELVPSFFTLNGALSDVAQSVMQGTSDELEHVGRDVVQENDRTLQPKSVLDPDGWNACLFSRAHSAAALGRPGTLGRSPFVALDVKARRDRDPIARAKRVMAGIANASRQACDPASPPDCPARFLTARTQGLAADLPAALAGIRSLLEQVPKWGQTRLLSYGLGGVNGKNFIREPEGAPDVPTGMLTQGDNLGADDVYQLPLGPLACRVTDPYDACWGEPRLDLHQIRHPTDAQRPFRTMLKTSIWAMNTDERLDRPGGVHWRVAYPDFPLGPGHVAPKSLGTQNTKLQQLGLNEAKRRFFGVVPVSVYVANVRPIQDGHHPWPGIAPFPLFEPGQFASRCPGTQFATGAGLDDAAAPLDQPAVREDDFNQPSVWASLERPTPSTQDPRRLAEQLAGDDDRPVLMPHAFARAQAYYHRPGDWSEHPNFFNPFWRARLAATLQGRGLTPSLQRTFDALPESLRRLKQRIVTH